MTDQPPAHMRTIFLALVGGLIVYEWIALRNECAGDTVSELVWSATLRRPIVPFAAGVLCGHFFWQQNDRRTRRGDRRRSPGASSP